MSRSRSMGGARIRRGVGGGGGSTPPVGGVSTWGRSPRVERVASCFATDAYAGMPVTHEATFSIVARCPHTGAFGAAVASRIPAVGAVVPHLRTHVGAIVTQ